MARLEIPPEKVLGFIQQHFDYKHRKNGAWVTICSPFDGDTGYHFNINIEKAICHDWRGDTWVGYDKNGKPAQKSFLRFVQRYLKCSFDDAVKAVLGSSVDLKALRKEERPKGQVELPFGSKLILGSDSKASLICRNYLNSRGISDGLIERYGICHCGTDIIWPYFEFDELVYWQSRSILDKVFRFPEVEGVGKGDYLYGFDLVEARKSVIITEAIIDAISLGDQAVASGGASLTAKQVRKLRFLQPGSVILAPDNDKAGLQSLLENEKLLCGFNLEYAVPPDGRKDWNEILVRDGDARSVFINQVKSFDMLARFEIVKKLST